MNLPRIFVDRPITTIMVFLGILAIGVVSIARLPLDLFPEIENPVISVVTYYPGASAMDVETNVTKEIESSLSTVNRLDKITSTSVDNLSVVQLKLRLCVPLFRCVFVACRGRSDCFAGIIF